MIHSLRGYKTHKCRCEVCTEAYNRYRARENFKNRRTPITHVLISGEPLVKIFVDRQLSGGNMSKKIQRWRTEGISVYEADTECLKLGYHPFEVFGASYFEGLEQEEAEYMEIYGEFEMSGADSEQ